MKMEKNCTNCKWYTVLKNYLNQDLPICRHEVAVGYEDELDLKVCGCTYHEPKGGDKNG